MHKLRMYKDLKLKFKMTLNQNTSDKKKMIIKTNQSILIERFIYK